MQSDQTPFVPAWLFEHGLSMTELVVLVYLWRRRNSKTGQCNPSMQTIARDLGVTRMTVSRAINTLERKRLLSRQSGGTGRSNGYRLNVLHGTCNTSVTSNSHVTRPVTFQTVTCNTDVTPPVTPVLHQGTERTNLKKVLKGSIGESWSESPEKQRERERRHTSELLARFFPDRCLSADEWKVNEDVPFGGPQAIHRVTGEVLESEQCA